MMRFSRLLILLMTLWVLTACRGGDPQENGEDVLPVELDLTAPFSDAPNHIINGGFETGDLSGWTTYGLAFNSTGVTSDTTYWNEGYPFNHEGHFHFYGFYSAPERKTGEMHSNVFYVESEGEVNFLFGAGRNHELVYVALVRAVDDEELDRVVNVNFSDPENANNYHRYAFDLDPHVGEYVYVKVVDNDDTGEGFAYANVDDFNVVYD